MVINLDEYDFRLLEVSAQLYALEDHLQLIENQIEHIKKTDRLRVDAYIHEQGYSPDDSEWDELLNEHNHLMQFLLPRLFRNSFLVTLYAVYESAVTEIARLIQKKQGQNISINDRVIKGDFLERAKIYYKQFLKFDLYVENKTWQRIKMLSELRDAFAHANGRLEMVKEKRRKLIEKWVLQKIGITIYQGYIVCDEKFVSDIFEVVRKSLGDLVARYKQWDDNTSQAVDGINQVPVSIRYAVN